MRFFLIFALIFLNLNCYGQLAQKGFEYSVLELLGKGFVKMNQMSDIVDKYELFFPVDKDTMYIIFDSLKLSERDKSILLDYSLDELKTIKLMKMTLGNKSLFSCDSFHSFYILDTISFFSSPLVYEKNNFKLEVIYRKNELSNSLIRLVAYKIEGDELVLAFDFDDYKIGFNVFVKMRNTGLPETSLTYKMYYISQHLLNFKKYKN